MQIVSNFFVIVKHGNASLFSLFVFLYFSICCYLASEGGFRTLRSYAYRVVSCSFLSM